MQLQNSCGIAHFRVPPHDQTMKFSPNQCRAARGLLGMTQVHLARKSGVSLRTIISFEQSEHQPMPANLRAIRGALEVAGAIFIDANGEGPGVRLRKRS